jgi:uncharacterized protein YjiS (DUF1127 family)
MTSLPVREPTTTADNDGLETRTHRHGMHPRPLASVLATFRGWLALRRQRRTLGGLTELDDHLLKDIGLSRPEAVRLCAKWFLATMKCRFPLSAHPGGPPAPQINHENF